MFFSMYYFDLYIYEYYSLTILIFLRIFMAVDHSINLVRFRLGEPRLLPSREFFFYNIVGLPQSNFLLIINSIVIHIPDLFSFVSIKKNCAVPNSVFISWKSYINSRLKKVQNISYWFLPKTLISIKWSIDN